MIRVALKLALAAAAVWAVWTFVPVRERTLAERWRAAGSVPAFVEAGWAEVAAATRSPAKAQARAQKPGARERPTESHTEADRRAVERIVADGLAERR